VLEKNGWEFYEKEYANEEETREQLSGNKINLSAIGTSMTFCGATDSFYRYCFDEKVFYIVINDTSIMVIKAK